MVFQRDVDHCNAVSENQIWKDRTRKEAIARRNYESWQHLYDEYKTLYSYCRNKRVPRVSTQKSQNFRRLTESVTPIRMLRAGYPETAQREIGWCSNYSLERFGTNIRGLKTKKDIYKSFNWPQN